MQNAARFLFSLLLIAALTGSVSAAPDAAKTSAPAGKAPAPAAKDTEYKRADMNYYWKGDVQKVDPAAVIVTAVDVTHNGGSYFTKAQKRAPKTIYLEVINDWIEPITPPDMPASLGVLPDAMQIREPHGDVKVAFPNNANVFVNATDGMTIPNGTVIKTGANGTTAVLFGGVASARLTPNSSAAVQQTVAIGARSTEVDLTRGAVFSKVGTRNGEKEEYEVHTPFGVAAARGTDFVTIAMPARTDVWIAQGTVELDQPNGNVVGTVKSDGGGALKIIRFPAMPDAHATMMASAETMTTAMNFIPTVNLKVKALLDKAAQGTKLTANEQDYLSRIKKVPCLIKLALVEAVPPAVVVPAPAPAAAVPAPVHSPAVATPKMADIFNGQIPVTIELTDDGTIQISGVPTSLDALAKRLTAIGKANKTQPMLIVADGKVPRQQVEKVLGMCKAANLNRIKRVKVWPDSPPPEPAAVAPTPAPAPVAMNPNDAGIVPLIIQLRDDGKIEVFGTARTPDEVADKLKVLAKVNPSQPVTVVADDKVPPKQVDKILAMCKAAHLTQVQRVKTLPAAPTPIPAPASAAPAVVNSGPMPITLRLHGNGKVDFEGAPYSFDDLKPKLVDAAKATPNQPVEIRAGKKATPELVQKLTDLVKGAGFPNVTVPPVNAAPAPSRVPPPMPPPPKFTPPAPALAPAVAPPVASSTPIDLNVRSDGKVDFQGMTLSLDELKPKLEVLGKTAPAQPIVVNGNEKAPKDEIKKILAMSHAAKLTKVTVARATPAPPLPAPTFTHASTPPPPAPAPAPAVTSGPPPSVKPGPPATQIP